MRVAIVGPGELEKGGITSVINNIVRNVSMPNVLLFRYGSWRSGSFYFRSVYSFFKLLIFPLFLIYKDIDIVYIHFAHKGSFIRTKYYARLARILNKKVILHSHSSSFDLYYKKSTVKKKRSIQKVFNENCDCLIVLGNSWRDFYLNVIGVSHEKIKVLHNAVSCTIITRYNPESKIITMFGRLGYRKGTYDILKVAKEFQQTRQDIKFMLYGDGDIEEVAKIIQKENLKNVYVKDWVSGEQKKLSISMAGLNLLPSHNEGMPMAILETMAQGIPNISTSVGSINEVIVDGVNGFIIPPGDARELYRTIDNYFYKEGPDYREEISYNARMKVETEFNISRYGQKLYSILRNVAGEN